MSARDGWLTLEDAIAIIITLEHDKPLPSPELWFARQEAINLVQHRAYQSIGRLTELRSTETDNDT
jgi:hypothetical protein